MKCVPAAATLVCAAALLLLTPRAIMAQTEKWSLLTGGTVWSSGVLGPDGTLYIGSNDGRVYAIDTVGNSSSPAGSVKWSLLTGDQVLSSGVLGPDGTLYIGSNDRRVYAISTGAPCSCGTGHYFEFIRVLFLLCSRRCLPSLFHGLVLPQRSFLWVFTGRALSRRILLQHKRAACSRCVPCRIVQRRVSPRKPRRMFTLPFRDVLFPPGSSISIGLLHWQLLPQRWFVDSRALPCR